MTFEIRTVTEADRGWIRELLLDRWAGEPILIRGVSHFPSTYPGFVAADGDERLGLITYLIEGDACEITSLDSLREGEGVGSALVEMVAEAARRAGCSRLRLVTTNDNEHALAWYGRRGFRVVGVRRGAMGEVRAVKPSIPLESEAGVPIRDEISLERSLVDG